MEGTGNKIFFSFLFFTYIIQLFLYYFISDDPIIWRKSEPSVYFYFSLLLFYMFFYFITFNSFKKKRFSFLEKILLRISLHLSKFIEVFWFKYRKIHVAFFFISSLLWFRQGLAGYRYDGVNIGDKLSVELVAGMLWKIFFYMDFWYHLTTEVIGGKKKRYKQKYLINISFLLILSGTTSAIYFLINFLYVYFPTNFIKTISISIKEVLTKKPYKLVKVTLIFSFVLSMLLYTYHAGEIIKTQRDMSFQERFKNRESLNSIKLFFVQRLSTTLYAHTFLIENLDYNIEDYYKNLNIAVDNFIYRVDVISGKMLNVDKPNLASINRLNYITIMNVEYDETSGASPGLIPGFLYIFPPWIAVLVSAWVLGILSILINLCIKDATFIYSSITMFLCLDLFKAIVLALNPLSTAFFQVIFFLGLVGVLYKQNYKISKVL